MSTNSKDSSKANTNTTASTAPTSVSTHASSGPRRRKHQVDVEKPSSDLMSGPEKKKKKKADPKAKLGTKEKSDTKVKTDPKKKVDVKGKEDKKKQAEPKKKANSQANTDPKAKEDPKAKTDSKKKAAAKMEDTRERTETKKRDNGKKKDKAKRKADILKKLERREELISSESEEYATYDLHSDSGSDFEAKEISPWDPSPRKILDVADLDLNKSYIPDIPPFSTVVARPPRQQRWIHPGRTPLTNVKDLPEGWNSKEPDLSEHDVDAQIKRCKERIVDNIMPQVFEQRLIEFQEVKKYRKSLYKGEPSHLSWEVIQRIDALKGIRKDILKEDKHEQLSNSDAILDAYRKGKLTRNAGRTRLVTYWSKGVQLSQPRPFDWDEFDAINDLHKGEKSFWVEDFMHAIHGLDEGANAMVVIPENESCVNANVYQPALRIPGYNYWDEMNMIWDTGAGYMRLYEGDLITITGSQRPENRPIRILGWARSVAGDGHVTNTPAVAIEVTLRNNRGKLMSPWVRTAACVQPGFYLPGRSSRLDGPWLRYSLYAGIAPDGRCEVIFATSRSELGMRRIGFEDRHDPRDPPLHQIEGAIKEMPLGPVPTGLRERGTRVLPEPGFRVPPTRERESYVPGTA
ncbi:hypothetical protein N7520_005235 [Penicillium odoratum]|uniref:uncharacterized protein n=1 Tax=Penicillium odoratum TaxID=1167516 RepID=UPI002547A76D|nr:uncharacterized protein N7520_005235 [Penicillium odoratum]KAJ5765676.1 hypothetical protein N7520_005235 [Penicillium odoratum]